MSFSKETLNKLYDIEEMEKSNAMSVWGQRYNSKHEAYAVILEELEEAKTEMTHAEINLSTLWASIKNNIDVEPHVINTRNNAILCAAECLQVAGCCDKFLDQLRGETL